jgi:hypothetical protein
MIKSLKYYANFKFLLAVGDIQPSAQVVQVSERNREENVRETQLPAMLTGDSRLEMLKIKATLQHLNHLSDHFSSEEIQAMSPQKSCYLRFLILFFV